MAIKIICRYLPEWPLEKKKTAAMSFLDHYLFVVSVESVQEVAEGVEEDALADVADKGVVFVEYEFAAASARAASELEQSFAASVAHVQTVVGAFEQESQGSEKDEDEGVVAEVVAAVGIELTGGDAEDQAQTVKYQTGFVHVAALAS